MVIAVASGKGGTGKTTVATGLALVAGPCQLLDCDVEEPNAHLFLRPDLKHQEPVSLLVPHVDTERCRLCGRCREACQFHALAQMGREVLVFPDLCHGCGACRLACQEGAIEERPREVGIVESGTAGEINVVYGRLQVGEPMAAPVIRAVKAQQDPCRLTIIDVAPGTACSVVEAVRGSDFCVLVTEPTPFGLSDLRLAVEVMQILALPCGVVINRAGEGEEATEEFCRKAGVPLLGRLPADRRVAEAYARGIHPVEGAPGFGKQMERLLAHLLDQVERVRP